MGILDQIDKVNRDNRRLLAKLYSEPGTKKKRNKMTSKQREFIWEHPKMFGRTCSICNQRITKLSDLEFDHTKAFSKGGKKVALAHRDCNKMKGSGSLKKIQKVMGFKQKTRKKHKKKSHRRKKSDTYGSLFKSWG